MTLRSVDHGVIEPVCGDAATLIDDEPSGRFKRREVVSLEPPGVVCDKGER